MIVLLALLPLQAWAGLHTSTLGVDMVRTQPATHQAAQTITITQDTVAVSVDQADFATPASPDTSCPADNAEPSSSGADLAEQLLPTPLPRVAASSARGAVPRYAGAALPDPDLPLLPRPPRG